MSRSKPAHRRDDRFEADTHPPKAPSSLSLFLSFSEPEPEPEPEERSEPPSRRGRAKVRFHVAR